MLLSGLVLSLFLYKLTLIDNKSTALIQKLSDHYVDYTASDKMDLGDLGFNFAISIVDD